MESESPKRAILTLLIVLIIGISAIVYIIIKIPPNNVLFWIVIALAGMCIHFFASILLYIFSKKSSHESHKAILRRKFRFGILIGMIGIILILVQKYFDVI